MKGVFVACDVLCLSLSHSQELFWLQADTDLPGIQEEEELRRGLAEGTFLAHSHSSEEVPGTEEQSPAEGILSPSELNLSTCVLACWSAFLVNNNNKKKDSVAL